ncbi:MAG: PKD domain-containing protein [archaeon]
MNLKKFIGILVVVFLINFVSASFEIGNLSHSIDTQYGPTDFIRGWVNMSLSSEPTDSLFQSSFGDYISLIDLLKTNENAKYSCSIIGCGYDYSSSGSSETEKNFNLKNGESVLIGFLFDENLVAINSVSFTVTSNAVASCTNQLEIDFLEDEDVDSGNYKASGESCASLKNYGCFDDNITAGKYKIEKSPSKHCQKIILTKSPGFKIGAYVYKNSGTKELTISIYNTYGEAVSGANCKIPSANLQEGGSEVFCEIDYLITEPAEYYVCIYSEEETTSQIIGYETGEKCGFRGLGIQPEIASFKIFAEGKKFANVGTIQITNLLGENSLSGMTNDYLMSKHGNMDCSSKLCFVPVKIISNQEQNVAVKNISIKYETQAGSKIKNNFYSLVKAPAKVSFDFQKIYLDRGNFSVPQEYRNSTFRLDFKGEEIFSQQISVEKVPIIKSISPVSTASAYPTVFEADVSSAGNISNYIWNFGDGNEISTKTNKATHAYNSTGLYNLKITAVDTENRSAHKTFEIEVISPKELINQTLEKMKKDLAGVEEEIKKFSSFEQIQLKKILQTEELNDALKEADRKYRSASSEEEYNSIIIEVISLKVPETLWTSKEAKSITFHPTESTINLEVLKKIGGGDYKTSEYSQYVDSIIIWNQNKFETKINFKEISAKYPNSREAILRVFDITANEKEIIGRNSYFILKKMENLFFKQNYAEKEESVYVYIELKEPKNSISFSTTEDIDFRNIPLFVSPPINNLVLSEKITEPEPEKFNWWILLFIFLVLILISVAIYIFLQQWYKYKYEKYLFKDRNNLYNLIIYIESSKKRGAHEKDIRTKLKKAGWSYEQINYAMKKHIGKRTGMIEIFPVEKIFRKFNKEKNPHKSN